MMCICMNFQRSVSPSFFDLRFADLISVQTMVLAAVMAANLFNGLNTNVWTVWVFFAVWVGTVLVWAYTVSETRFRVAIG
jgi:hypothetical protein